MLIRGSVVVLLLSLSQAQGFMFSLGEPEIQCTTIKVVSTMKLKGIESFPKKNQVVSNDAVQSELVIAGKRLPEVDPVLKSKTVELEVIEIPLKEGSLILEILGQPLSRQALLKYKGNILARLTCH
jgi:hypothetical protein